MTTAREEIGYCNGLPHLGDGKIEVDGRVMVAVIEISDYIVRTHSDDDVEELRDVVNAVLMLVVEQASGIPDEAVCDQVKDIIEGLTTKTLKWIYVATLLILNLLTVSMSYLVPKFSVVSLTVSAILQATKWTAVQLKKHLEEVLNKKLVGYYAFADTGRYPVCVRLVLYTPVLIQFKRKVGVLVRTDKRKGGVLVRTDNIPVCPAKVKQKLGNAPESIRIFHAYVTPSGDHYDMSYCRVDDNTLPTQPWMKSFNDMTETPVQDTLNTIISSFPCDKTPIIFHLEGDLPRDSKLSENTYVWFVYKDKRVWQIYHPEEFHFDAIPNSNEGQQVGTLR